METTRSSPPYYHAYLLRIWLSNGAAEGACWQASLQDAAGGQRIGFASLEALFVYLMNDITGDLNDGAQEPDATSRRPSDAHDADGGLSATG